MKIQRMALVVLFACSVGCGSSGHDELIAEQIRSLEEAAEILEALTDFDSAGAARPKLKNIIKRIEEQNARARELPPPTAEEMRAIGARTHEASKAALDRLNQAARQARARAGCEDVVAEFRRDLDRLLR